MDHRIDNLTNALGTLAKGMFERLAALEQTDLSHVIEEVKDTLLDRLSEDHATRDELNDVQSDISDLQGTVQDLEDSQKELALDSTESRLRAIEEALGAYSPEAVREREKLARQVVNAQHMRIEDLTARVASTEALLATIVEAACTLRQTAASNARERHPSS